MASLIEQLRRESLDPSTSIADLLRKAKVVAVKLDRADAAEWIDHELNGYLERVEVPKYRTIIGDPRFLNPMLGWRPLVITDPGSHERMTTYRAREAISELEALLRVEGELYRAYPGRLVQDLARQVGIPIGGAGIFLGKPAIERIRDAVRTRVLEWAVTLEKAGVRGEGQLSFSGRESQVAPQAAVEPAQRLTIKGRVENNPIRWLAWALAVGAAVGFSAGLFIRDLVDAAVRRVATVQTRPAATPPHVPPANP